MNNLWIGEHPSEEQLMELAVSGGPPEIKEHTDTCVSCAGIVKEFREVKEQVALLSEKEVPQRVERHILDVTRHGHGANFLQAFFSNPYLIALAVGIVVILLYFLVGSEVFKTP
jgi:hypothetical protein